MPITKESVAARRKKKAGAEGKAGGKRDYGGMEAGLQEAVPGLPGDEPVRLIEPAKEAGLAVMRQPAAEVKCWAPFELCDRELADVRSVLQLVFGPEDGIKAYCIAILRACRDGLKLHRLAAAYERSFLSEFYPGVNLSRKSVERLFRELGRKGSKVPEFMRQRVRAAGEKRPLLISWVDRQDIREAEQHDIASSGGSGRKARFAKGRSVLYAYDLGAMEPVCAKYFNGEDPDEDTVRSFLEKNSIERGFVLSGKVPRRYVPGMNYLVPLKRVQDMDGAASCSGGILSDCGTGFRKWRQGKNGRWIYCFTKKDAAGEKASKSAWKQGVRSFESALDIPPDEVWRALNLRRRIRKSLRLTLAAADFDELSGACGSSDRSQEVLPAEEASRLVAGSEFCDFLSMLLASRLARVYVVSGLQRKWTYREMQEELAAITAVRAPGGSWELGHVSSDGISLLRRLSLLDLPPENRQETDAAAPAAGCGSFGPAGTDAPGPAGSPG